LYGRAIGLINTSENMGLAKISGGTYEIADSEGRAIENIIPLTAIQSINWNPLTDVQTWLLSEMVVRWEILAHWLVSCRTRAVDTKQMPFTSLEFLDQETKANLYSIQLDLCAVIWREVEGIEEHYSTPYDWWIKCIRENQQKQIESILLGKSDITKGEIEDETRYLRRALNNESIPYAKSLENTHLYTMFNFAIKLKRNYEQIKSFWNLYIAQLNKLAKELKANNEIKAIISLGGRLYYRDRNTLKPIPITRIKKDDILNIRAGFEINW